MAAAIRFVLTNLPAFLFLAALIVPTIWHSQPFASRYLAWMLLLSVGVDMLWAGLFHIFFPTVAAAQIGWQISPFQFEIGVADAAMGVTAIASFWRSMGFKAAVVVYVSLFYVGVAVGHIRDAMTAANFAPDNFGILLLLTIVKIPILIGLLWRACGETRHLR